MKSLTYSFVAAALFAVVLGAPITCVAGLYIDGLSACCHVDTAAASPPSDLPHRAADGLPASLVVEAPVCCCHKNAAAAADREQAHGTGHDLTRDRATTNAAESAGPPNDFEAICPKLRDGVIDAHRDAGGDTVAADWFLAQAGMATWRGPPPLQPTAKLRSLATHARLLTPASIGTPAPILC